MQTAALTADVGPRSERIQRTVRKSLSAAAGPLSPRSLFEEIEKETGARHHEALEVVRTMIEEGELMLTDDFNLQRTAKFELAA
jgi:hypothetical protein